MRLQTFKPRIGTRTFRLARSILHCINLCRHNKHVEIVSYLRTLEHRDRTEVYGRTLSWMAENASYEDFITLRTIVWSSDIFTSHVKVLGSDGKSS